MSFGMRIWGEDSKLQMDENSFTVRVIYSGVVERAVGGGVSTFISIPGVRAATHAAVILPIGAYPQDPNAQNAYACQYEPDVINDGVMVYFNNRLYPGGAAGLAPQRLLVMKIR